jgi:DNA-binding MarR family transcriptional regulator
MMTQITKTPEDIIFEQCLAGRLRILNRVVTNMYDEALRPLGVKTSQLNILVAAGKLGVARPADICERLQLDTSTLSRNVERMRAKGWLEVVGDVDGRAQPFRLTTKGHKLVEKAKPRWEKAQKKVRKLLGNETVQTIVDAVEGLQTANVR